MNDADLGKNIDQEAQVNESYASRAKRFQNGDAHLVSGYISAICRLSLSATAAGPLLEDIKFPENELIWSQAFYYGIWATTLYFLDASLMAVTFWGALSGHYRKDFMLTSSQRTLMLQTIMFLLYLLLGALVFSNIEDWNFLDAVYWADVSLFTVGFGDYAPTTTLGRALLMPYALIGVISLGLVISSVRSLILERGRRCVAARIEEKKRRRVIQTMTRSGDDAILKPICRESEISRIQSNKIPATEFERRKAEFALMRKIQAQASSRRRWIAMAISTTSWLVLWLVGAIIFEKSEKTYQDWSYFDSFYFCFVAWTTIGYGDLAPISNAGKSFFVFWSLLALPTMTVLISNASDTVVKFIRDSTLRLGNATILPGEEDFICNLKHIVSKITFGRAFSSHLDSVSPKLAESSKSTDQRLTEIMTESDEQTLQDDDRGGPSTSVVDQRVSQSRRPKHTHAPPTFTSRIRRSLPCLHNPHDKLPTGTDFHLLLISEIQIIAIHLKESKPHHYTFDQWAWYLKLIGEDERNAATHCKAKPKEKRSDPNIENSDNEPTWSWVGNRNPLMGSQEESEWILDRLMDRLRKSLSAEKRRQLRTGPRLAHQEAQEV
ncbi:Outward-rectifier potassium channel TOK1 [Fusarium oxysporum f. sp. raphani]|uniref:Outward-rectifier potassium channel TOK1 n=1 Tax=Fusarium oxysporum f. sp. raphani TaxID=96318 RepID=A0A8J5PBD2_FUSOX|nr:Outward-rectifier potassium channel TOK1 [Fusarium oxysporum f. sp. raphani]